MATGSLGKGESYDHLVKVVVIGDTAVGKTCLVLRYTHDTYRESFLSTIGVDFKTKTISMNKKNYKLQIWDTAGQERYNSIRRNFYRGAKGVIITYDMTNYDSYNSITRWMTDVSNNLEEEDGGPAVLILANKADLEEERAVSRRAGEEAARAFKAKYAEVSAKTGEGVDEAIGGLVQEMVKLVEAEVLLKIQSLNSLGSIKLGEGVNQTDSSSTCSC